MYTCPVCGFNELEEQPYGSGGGGSDEICPSCFFQFGYHDHAEGITHEEWREQWINERDKPPHWNPKAQLRRIGVIVA